MWPFENLIITIFALIIMAIFGWVLYAIFMSIFQFVFSWWNTEKIKKAWNNIRYAFLGVIFSFLILFAVPAIVSYSKIDGYKYYTTGEIFKMSKKIIKTITDVLRQSNSNKKDEIIDDSGIYVDYEL